MRKKMDMPETPPRVFTVQQHSYEPCNSYRLIDDTTVQTKMQTVSEDSNVSTTVSA
jgi:hypothetical protein